MCTEADRFQPLANPGLICQRVFNVELFEFVKVEILSRKPAIIRIHKFGDDRIISQIYEAFHNST